MNEAKRYVVQLSPTLGGAFQPDGSTNDLDKAKIRCALKAALNPRVAAGRVEDTQTPFSTLQYPYCVRSKFAALEDLAILRRQLGLHGASDGLKSGTT